MKIINLLTIGAFAVLTLTPAANAADCICKNDNNGTTLGITPMQVTIADNSVVLQGKVESNETAVPAEQSAVDFAFTNPKESLKQDMLRFKAAVPANQLY